MNLVTTTSILIRKLMMTYDIFSQMEYEGKPKNVEPDDGLNSKSVVSRLGLRELPLLNLTAIN
jgi:hypothetical protein